MPPPYRLLIVEEALKNRRGHWYEYNRAIILEARRRGIDTTVLAHRDLESDLEKELGARPYFPATSWDHVYYHPSEWRRYLGILHHNFRVARWVSRHLAAHPPYDVVLVPTVVLYHWLAWRWLAFRGLGRHFRKLVLTTRNNAGEYDPATARYQYPRSAQILRRVVHSFKALVRARRVEIASDSSRLASQYQELCGVPVTTYPHPRPTEHLPVPALAADPSRPLVFSALGPPRYEKGSDLILEAVRLVRSRRPDLPIQFVLQWTGTVSDPAGQRFEPSAELRADPAVTFIHHDLTTDAYQQRLEASCGLLLPYRRAQYHARLSGVAIEAFQMGVPCVCIADTWIADSMAAIGAGVVMPEETADCLAAAMIELAERNQEYRARSHERIALARKTHSPGTFVDLLFAGAVSGSQATAGPSSLPS